MPSHRTRISIIGCGHVGTSCAHALLLDRLTDELILIDGIPDKARGEALDLQHAVPLGQPMHITAGTYKDAAASAIVIITVGTPDKFSGNRLALLAGSVTLVRECIAQLMAENFDGILLIATNPVDVLTYIAQTESGLPIGHVIGTGTLIDSERLRFILGASLNIDARSIHASVIGEHGESSVAVWSAAQIAGLPLALYPGAYTLPSRDDLLSSVRQAGPEVAELKGNTSYAIAACVVRICEAILHDERSVLIVSTRMTGQYGLHDVSLSTPCIVGKSGIEFVLELHLDPAEQKALEHSASVLQQAAAQVKAV